jgi:hypothetical protein
LVRCRYRGRSFTLTPISAATQQGGAAENFGGRLLLLLRIAVKLCHVEKREDQRQLQRSHFVLVWPDTKMALALN